jgi:hypothetical protein
MSLSQFEFYYSIFPSRSLNTPTVRIEFKMCFVKAMRIFIFTENKLL